MNKILLLAFVFISNCIYSQCAIGDSCVKFDEQCLASSKNSIIQKFVLAGVKGGVPNSLEVVKTIDSTFNIQKTINKIHKKGGGVIVLSPGIYKITSTLYLKNNVVLRGEDSNAVILESTIRSTWKEGKKSTIEFNNVSNAGIENLTILYKVANFKPIDRKNRLDGGWCNDCFKNDPHELKNLYVRQVYINRTSFNCWVDGCKILNSGTDPIRVDGNNNTLRNNFIDRCYNKGALGNGYYDIRGSYNLFSYETVKRIRHFAIQQKAQFNVIVNCYLEVDVNFHNGDNGNNLLENNEINVPTWHGWDIFGTGGVKYGHLPPGNGNIMVNNKTNYKNKGGRYSEINTVYTFSGYGAPVKTSIQMPKCNSFYPVLKPEQ